MKARKRYTRRRTKKKKEVVDLVTKCDQCSKLLVGTLARTFGSAFTAYDRGLKSIDPGIESNERKVSKWMFFCNDECLSKFNECIDAI